MPVTTDRQFEWAGLLLDPPYRIQQVEGLLGLPDMRTGDLERVVGDGDVAGVDRLGGRTVTITLVVDDETTADFGAAVAALQATLPPTGVERALVFKLPGVAAGNTARIWARARRAAGLVDTLYHQGASEVVVELRATDPRIYDDTETTTTLTPATPSGGRTYDRTYDMSYGGLGNAGTATIINAGNVAAGVRILGPVTDPKVTNETTGQSLELDIALAMGEFVDLDSRDRTVLLNGTANRYHLLVEADWWELQPGSNQLRFTASVPTGSSASVTWRSAWI
jgi:hypothetical protein